MTWHFWIDRGGTFTDVVARDPDGRLHTAKLLSSDPERYADAAVEAVRRLTGAGSGPMPPCALRIGTTIATNALLERKGEPVLLAVTRGFRDAIRIGTQERPDLFARQIRLPDPLHEHFRHFTRRLHTIEHDPEAGFVALPPNLIGKADALRNLVERLPCGFVGV